ncbi:MAG: hypothetical protein WAN86_25030, partial [Hyphomicrobiaceae bacterium]
MTDDTPRPTMEAARPAGPVTTMHIVLDGEPVIATRIPAASLEGHLDGAEADIVRLGRTRADVADQVRSAFESGSWRTPKIRAALARAMLWLALRGDASLAERARKTPMTLVWHVIQRPGVWNLVLHPGDTPDRAAMPAEAPPDVGAAGDPAPGERGHG